MNKVIKRKNTRKYWNRVDAQVSILTALVVTIACLCTYIFGYNLTYNDMIYGLKERITSIYTYMDSELDRSTFYNINLAEDMGNESYQKMKRTLENVKNASGVQYLYTAKRNAQGDLIYVIDGLTENAEDFRKPGDLIEEEVRDELNKALNGQVILPDSIVKTNWGEVFVAYLPVYDEKNVVGAMGIEFKATHQYKTYYWLKILAPVIIIMACILGALMSLVMFRRISNPHYKDLANTDYLTGLKNRNAYEVDIKNLCALELIDGVGIIIADLNGLKIVNDSFGHDKGDDYIKCFAEALKAAQTGDEVLYRTGGDEFIIITKSATDERLQEFIKSVGEHFEFVNKCNIPKASCSFGTAICYGCNVVDYEDAYRIADKNMYANKRSILVDVDGYKSIKKYHV